MKNIYEIKTKASELLSQAQRYLSEEDELDATIFYFYEDRIQTLTVRVEDQKDKEFLRGLLTFTKAMTDSLVLIIDSFVADVGNKDLKDFTGSVSDLEDSSSALMAFLYTKDKTYTKTVLYKKRGPRDYVFLDTDWKEDNIEGIAKNPYLS